MFKVGDKVRWESQSGASWTYKEGVIFQVLPAGERRTFRDFPNAKVMFDGSSRNHESYLVEVMIGPRAKPRIYWPRVSNLRHA